MTTKTMVGGGGVGSIERVDGLGRQCAVQIGPTNRPLKIGQLTCH